MNDTPIHLHAFIARYYDGKALRPLCFRIGEGRQARARELVAYLERQRRLDRLCHHLWTSRREPIRQRELAYLDDVLIRYAFGRDRYTPLAGIQEVRAAVQDGPCLRWLVNIAIDRAHVKQSEQKHPDVNNERTTK